MLRITNPNDLRDLIETLNEQNSKVNRNSKIIIPLNIFVFGKPGIGKTTSIINYLEQLDIPYAFFASSSEALPSSLIGPVDVPALIKDNELKRKLEEGIFDPNKQVAVIDEADVLSTALLEALKSYLTAPIICTAEGCIISSKPLIIATGNAPLEEILLRNNIPEETANAILDRFPFRVEYSPVLTFEEVYNFLEKPLNLNFKEEVYIDNTAIPVGRFIQILLEQQFSARNISQILCIRNNERLLKMVLKDKLPVIISQVEKLKKIDDCIKFKAKAIELLNYLRSKELYDSLNNNNLSDKITSIIKVLAKEKYDQLVRDGIPTSADKTLDTEISMILEDIRKIFNNS